MNEKLKMYALCKNLKEKAYLLLKEIEETYIFNKETSLEDLADISLALDKSQKMMEDLRKDIKRKSELAQRLACLAYVKDQMEGPIRGEFSTCSVKVSHQISIPQYSKDPAVYRAFMAELGVSEEMIKCRAITPHWPHMIEWITDKVNRGEKLPTQLDPRKTVPLYSLTCRVGRGIDDLDTLLRKDSKDDRVSEE